MEAPLYEREVANEAAPKPRYGPDVLAANADFVAHQTKAAVLPAAAAAHAATVEAKVKNAFKAAEEGTVGRFEDILLDKFRDAMEHIISPLRTMIGEANQAATSGLEEVKTKLEKLHTLDSILVLSIRAENRARGSGERTPYLEVPLPDGELPSSKGLPKLTSAAAFVDLTLADALSLAEAWGIPREDSDIRVADLRDHYVDLLASHVGATRV